MDELANVRISEEERQFFDDVDGVIARAVTIGDPLIAFEYGSLIKRKQALAGVALAKLLYKLEESWGLFEAKGIEDDLLTMADMHMMVKPETAKKYVRMWGDIFENPSVPDDIKMILRGRNIGDLLLLTAAVREGQLSGENLLAAALTPDTNTLRDKISEVRGEQTSSSSAIRIFLATKDKGDIRAGTVYAQQGRKKEVLFTLKKKYEDLGEKAIERIKNSTHIIEEFN